MSVLGYYNVPYSTSQSLLLDANNSTSYPGSGTAWTDLTQLHNNVTLSGTSFSSSPGALTFLSTGTGTFSSPINMAVANFTINVWVKFNAIGADQFLLDTSTNGAAGNGYSIRLTSANKFRFWAYNAVNFLDSPSTYTSGTWYNVCATYNNTTQLQSLYVNGALVSSNTATGFVISNLTNLRIGKPVLFTSSFTGALSVLEFYPVPLNATQVNQKFNYYRNTYGI